MFMWPRPHESESTETAIYFFTRPSVHTKLEWFRAPSTRIQETKNASIRVDKALRSLKKSTLNGQSDPYDYQFAKW